MTIMSTALLPVLSDRPMAGSIQASMSLPILPFQRRQPLSYGTSVKGTGSLPDILEALRNSSVTGDKAVQPVMNNTTVNVNETAGARQRTTSLDGPLALQNNVECSLKSSDDSPLPVDGDRIVIDENNNVVVKDSRPVPDTATPVELTNGAQTTVAVAPAQRRRKNSSMQPIIPDMNELEAMRTEYEQTQSNTQQLHERLTLTIDDSSDTDSDIESIKTPKLIQCGESFCSEKESAAAWLAAAMSAMSTSPMSSKMSPVSATSHHHRTKQPALVGVVAAATAAAKTAAYSLETSAPTFTTKHQSDFEQLTCPAPSPVPVSVSDSFGTPISSKTTDPVNGYLLDDTSSIIKNTNNNNNNNNNNDFIHNNNNNDITAPNNNAIIAGDSAVNGASSVAAAAATVAGALTPVLSSSPLHGGSKAPATQPIQAPTRRLSRPLTPPKVEQLDIQNAFKSHTETEMTLVSVSPPSSTLLQQQTTKPTKPLLPFGGKEDKVRRTSILRPPTHYLDSQHCYAKKNVRFADSLGLALENIRLFTPAPQVSRRYSSYNAPTTKSCEFDSPWNMALGPNRSKESIISFSSYSSSSAPVSIGQYHPMSMATLNGGSASKRYELQPANFTSPSLQLNFDTELERQGVMLHSLTCAETTVYGTVSVMNRHFDKHVIVRYTFNEWSSYIERDAAYMLGSHDGRTDKFSFAIYARPEDFQPANNHCYQLGGRLHFAICFKTGDGLELWDNNHDRNYTLNFVAH